MRSTEHSTSRGQCAISTASSARSPHSELRPHRSLASLAARASILAADPGAGENRSVDADFAPRRVGDSLAVAVLTGDLDERLLDRRVVGRRTLRLQFDLEV